MKAYILVEIEIHDQELYEKYKKMTPETIREFEGEFVVRGGEFQVLEGQWQPERLVILSFPSKEKALAWWNSESYTRAKLLRQRAAKTKMLLLEGH